MTYSVMVCMSLLPTEITFTMRMSLDPNDDDGKEANLEAPPSIQAKLDREQDQDNALRPDSPMDQAIGLSSSSSSDSEDVSIPNTQDKGKQKAEEDSFETQLQEHDKLTKAQLGSEADKSLDIYMTQAEEERLPMPPTGTTKRKKEPSKDPPKASVSLAKPSKNSEK